MALLTGNQTGQVVEEQNIYCYIVPQLLGTIETFDRFECLGACQDYPGCLWFSSNEENGFCGLFETCDDISTENCPQCVSGTLNLGLISVLK